MNIVITNPNFQNTLILLHATELTLPLGWLHIFASGGKIQRDTFKYLIPFFLFFSFILYIEGGEAEGEMRN